MGLGWEEMLGGMYLHARSRSGQEPVRKLHVGDISQVQDVNQEECERERERTERRMSLIIVKKNKEKGKKFKTVSGAIFPILFLVMNPSLLVSVA